MRCLSIILYSQQLLVYMSLVHVERKKDKATQHDTRTDTTFFRKSYTQVYTCIRAYMYAYLERVLCGALPKSNAMLERLPCRGCWLKMRALAFSYSSSRCSKLFTSDGRLVRASNDCSDRGGKAVTSVCVWPKVAFFPKRMSQVKFEATTQRILEMCSTS